MATEPGDVIEVLPDTHRFTPTELANQDWRFIRVPLLPIEADAIKAPDIDPVTKRARHMRAQRVPLSLLERVNAGEIRDIARAAFVAGVRRKD